MILTKLIFFVVCVCITVAALGVVQAMLINHFHKIEQRESEQRQTKTDRVL